MWKTIHEGIPEIIYKCAKVYERQLKWLQIQ